MNYSKLFQLKNYLYSMTIYHIIAIIFFVVGITGFKLQTMVSFDDVILGRSQGFLEAMLTGQNINTILIISAVLLSIDFILLIIVWYDFPQLGLTWNKLYIIEVILFVVALFIPIVRAIMMFLSLNTLPIFFFYHVALWCKKFDFTLPQYVVVLGGYIFMFKILTYPLSLLR